ncbi:MAG: NAC family transcription factor [Methanoregula sp.]|nr:NAC family transcription factor [Methanoregula sp.]
MGGDDKDGTYCSICGGIPPDRITTKRVLIDGKETGIDHLDWIFDEVKKLEVRSDALLAEEILKRVKQFNYVPTKKTDEYMAGLLAAYRKFLQKKD